MAYDLQRLAEVVAEVTHQATIDQGEPVAELMTCHVVQLEVDAEGADAWLRALGEVRLVLHVRTGQDKHDLPDDVTDDDIAQLRDVIDWVGFVQGTLLEALDGRMSQ